MQRPPNKSVQEAADINIMRSLLARSVCYIHEPKEPCPLDLVNERICLQGLVLTQGGQKCVDISIGGATQTHKLWPHLTQEC